MLLEIITEHSHSVCAGVKDTAHGKQLFSSYRASFKGEKNIKAKIKDHKTNAIHAEFNAGRWDDEQ